MTTYLALAAMMIVSAPPTKKQRRPPTPEEWLAQCPERKLDGIISGATRTGVGGGYIAVGTVIAGSGLAALALLADSGAGAGAAKKAIYVNIGLGAIVTIIGGVTMSSGRGALEENATIECPPLPVRPPAPVLTPSPAPQTPEPPTAPQQP